MSILQILKVALVRQFRTALSHTVTLAAGGHLNTNSLKLTKIIKPRSLLCISVGVAMLSSHMCQMATIFANTDYKTSPESSAGQCRCRK